MNFADIENFADIKRDAHVPSPTRPSTAMKVRIKHWSAVAQWRWNTGNVDQDDEGDVCGICRVPYEGCCPSCKMPGEDCPLSEHGFLFPRLVPDLREATWARDTILTLMCTRQYGASVVTSFICTVCSSGSVPPRRNSSVQWTVDLGVRVPPLPLARERDARLSVTAERKVSDVDADPSQVDPNPAD
jgi:hypothetical protein